MNRRRMTSRHDTLAGGMAMRQVQNGARGVRAQRRYWWTAGLMLALLTNGCLQDGASTGPSGGAARLALNANVAGSSGSMSAVTALRVEVSYLRGEGQPAPLLDQLVPLSGSASGGIVRQPVSVDLGACLGDPLHQPGGNACGVMVRVTLLAGDAVLDVVNIGPLTLRPGETSSPAEVTLHTASKLVVAPATPGPLFPGETVQLTATLLDATGAPVEGREIGWANDAPSVATVDATGKVTAVSPGNALITASGGDLTSSVTVRVVARSTIVIDRQAITFEARQSGAAPEGQSVRIVNGAAGTLDDLALGTISYGPGASNWLSATLSGTSAPATLLLRPTRTDLQPGKYTATVPLTAPTATNSGMAVQVSYSVSAASVLKVGQSLFQLSGRFYESPAVLRTSVTAQGPLSGLTAEVTYGPSHVANWLAARFTSDNTPSELVLEVQGYQLPGNYQAQVRITAPSAANDQTVDVLWTVPPDGFYFDLHPSPECVYFEGQPAGQDTVYLGASLSDSAGGYLDGMAFTVRSLNPGLIVVSSNGTTGQTYALAVNNPGFRGDVLVEATLGGAPQAPGALKDTALVQIVDDYYACYEGGGSLAPYTPGAPTLRRAPAVRPPTPAPGRTVMPRSRKAMPASETSSGINRSRPTPEHN